MKTTQFVKTTHTQSLSPSKPSARVTPVPQSPQCPKSPTGRGEHQRPLLRGMEEIVNHTICEAQSLSPS